MPYCGLMPYAMQFPASQLRSRMKVCLMRGSTVVDFGTEILQHTHFGVSVAKSTT
jgi:hypothetical protein